MRGKKTKTPTPSRKGSKITQETAKPVQTTQNGLALTNPKNEQKAIDQAVKILQAAGISIEERDVHNLAETRRIKVHYTPLESDSLNTKNAKINFLSYLQRALGVVATASKLSGVSRQTHYAWMASDPGYKAYCEEINEMVLDFAESKLHENIRDGKETSIIFFLKTRAKRRGYIETHHLINEEVPIHVTRTIVDPQNG